jgi:hypothetical protein
MRNAGKYRPYSPGFLPKATTLRIRLFFKRKMSEKLIDWADAGLLPRHITPSLSQDLRDSDALHIGGFSTLIGSCQDKDLSILVHTYIVGDDCCRVYAMRAFQIFVYQEHVIRISHLANALLDGCDARPAGGQPQALETLDKAYGSQVIN